MTAPGNNLAAARTGPPLALRPGSMSGLDKAVAVLSAMGHPVAARLAEHFGEEERARLLGAANALGNLSPDVIETIVAEFEEAFIAGVGAMDNLATLEAVFEQRLSESGPRATSVWPEAEGAAERLGSLLADENPQVVVLIARRLAPQAAARLLAALPEKRAREVVRRIADARSPSPLALERVEAHVAALLARGTRSGDGPAPLTAILNELDRDMAEALIREADLSDEVAARVRGGLFGFADLGRLPGEDRATLLDGVEGEALVAALSGADDALASAVLDGLSPRTRRMVEAQRVGARVDAATAEAARRTIAARARALAAEGSIALPEPTA